MTSDVYFEDVAKLEARRRQRVLQKLRRSDLGFLTEDVRVVVCTAVVKNSGGDCFLYLSFLPLFFCWSFSHSSDYTMFLIGARQPSGLDY